MKYGLLTIKKQVGVNIGDYIQALAARQFLPEAPIFLDRERLDEYEGELIKLIMNGWFMHEPDNWPPSDKIKPLLISMHLNPGKRERMVDGRGREFFTENGPVGCRDRETFDFLKKERIDAYFSGCLTLTLGNSYKRDEKNVKNKIYLVDPLFSIPSFRAMYGNLISSSKLGMTKRLITSFLSRRYWTKRGIIRKILKDVSGEIEYIRHAYPASFHASHEEMFSYANLLLEKYRDAKLVVTSRIHCALPCLAMGTPVIFIEELFLDEGHHSRFEGLSDLFNTVSVDKNMDIHSNFDIDQIKNDSLNFNPMRHVKIVEKLNNMCKEFLENDV